MEKLQLLNSPEERQRRLNETQEVHPDPSMDPSYESEDNAGDFNKKQGPHLIDMELYLIIFSFEMEVFFWKC